MNNLLFELKSMKKFLEECNNQTRNQISNICHCLDLESASIQEQPKFSINEIICFKIDHRKYKILEISSNASGAYFYNIISLDDGLKIVAVAENYIEIIND